MKDSKTKERFIELRASGMAYAKIADELKVSKQTLIGWSKELANEISNLQAIEWEALFDKHRIAKQHRVRLFGSLLDKLAKEVEARDFTSLPTEKVLGLLVKVSESLKAEESETVFKGEDAFVSLSTPVSWPA